MSEKLSLDKKIEELNKNNESMIEKIERYGRISLTFNDHIMFHSNFPEKGDLMQRASKEPDEPIALLLKFPEEIESFLQKNCVSREDKKASVLYLESLKKFPEEFIGKLKKQYNI